MGPAWVMLVQMWDVFGCFVIKDLFEIATTACQLFSDCFNGSEFHSALGVVDVSLDTDLAMF